MLLLPTIWEVSQNLSSQHYQQVPQTRRDQSFFVEFLLEQVSMATIKNLKIKTATCKRIIKELHSYEKEVEREAAKTADMKEKGADPYDLKQQENVLAESRMMVPDCHKRLESALADLKGALAELEESTQEKGQEFDDARSTITEIESFLKTTEE
ncbi:unnamed protein product [Citrullus colocynthis]|uniref:Tubulin-specific chaperone A n=1 Tax=Citrullus colocynthis TaxID=252529 RepID=A0ABP0Z6Y2_9ROSI